ncbi:hypothetical protein [Nocardioides litoris]|uniref:hypothetical protein n=1 Tax=Nocardioides litoris TaxID=1926648 RepID=UPI00112271BE|nr:hypothetical protein [Nocardioides litoris]
MKDRPTPASTGRRSFAAAVAAVVAAALLPAGLDVGASAAPAPAGLVGRLADQRYGPAVPRPWDPPSLTPRGTPLDLDVHGADTAYDHERDRLFLAGRRTGDAAGSSAPRVLDTGAGRWSELEGADGATVVDTDRAQERLFVFVPDPQQVVVYDLDTLEVVARHVVDPDGADPRYVCPSSFTLVQGLLWMPVVARDRSDCETLAGLDPVTGEWFVPLTPGPGGPGPSDETGQATVDGEWRVGLTADVPGDPAALLVGGDDDGDVSRLQVTRAADGTPSVVRVARAEVDVTEVEAAPDGRTVYLTGNGLPEVRDARTLAVLDRLGDVETTGSALSVAPDGRVAIGRPLSAEAEVFLYHPGRTEPYRSWELGPDHDPAVSAGEPESQEPRSLVLGGGAAWTVSEDYLSEVHELRRMSLADRVRVPSTVTSTVVPAVATYGQQVAVVAAVAPAEAGRDVYLDLRATMDERYEEVVTDGRGVAVLRHYRPEQNTLVEVDARPTDRALWRTTRVLVRVRPAATAGWQAGAAVGTVRPSAAARCVRVEVQRYGGPRGQRRWRPTPWGRACAGPTAVRRDDTAVVTAQLPSGSSRRRQVLRTRLVVPPQPGRWEGVTTRWERTTLGRRR